MNSVANPVEPEVYDGATEWRWVSYSDEGS